LKSPQPPEKKLRGHPPSDWPCASVAAAASHVWPQSARKSPKGRKIVRQAGRLKERDERQQPSTAAAAGLQQPTADDWKAEESKAVAEAAPARTRKGID
jgi:hypothetical protein